MEWTENKGRGTTISFVKKSLVENILRISKKNCFSCLVTSFSILHASTYLQNYLCCQESTREIRVGRTGLLVRQVKVHWWRLDSARRGALITCTVYLLWSNIWKFAEAISVATCRWEEYGSVPDVGFWSRKLCFGSQSRSWQFVVSNAGAESRAIFLCLCGFFVQWLCLAAIFESVLLALSMIRSQRKVFEYIAILGNAMVHNFTWLLLTNNPTPPNIYRHIQSSLYCVSFASICRTLWEAWRAKKLNTQSPFASAFEQKLHKNCE